MQGCALGDARDADVLVAGMTAVADRPETVERGCVEAGRVRVGGSADEACVLEREPELAPETLCRFERAAGCAASLASAGDPSRLRPRASVPQ